MHVCQAISCVFAVTDIRNTAAAAAAATTTTTTNIIIITSFFVFDQAAYFPEFTPD